MRESGGYLGGIGVMLGSADICPTCGETHPEPQYGIRHGAPRECPKVVLGSFPVLDRLEEEDETLEPFPRASAARKIREFETPLPPTLSASPAYPPEGREPRARGLGVPWLRPPDLGEVL